MASSSSRRRKKRRRKRKSPTSNKGTEISEEQEYAKIWIWICKTRNYASRDLSRKYHGAFIDQKVFSSVIYNDKICRLLENALCQICYPESICEMFFYALFLYPFLKYLKFSFFSNMIFCETILNIYNICAANIGNILMKHDIIKALLPWARTLFLFFLVYLQLLRK